MIVAGNVYVFTKSGNNVRAIEPSLPYTPASGVPVPLWEVERVDTGERLLVPESALEEMGDRAENEEWYDENVAPVLADLATKCNGRGMPFLAAVGNHGDRYCTRYLSDTSDPAIRLIFYAMKALGNIDAFLATVIEDAEERGGTEFSIYLTDIKRYRNALERGRL